MGRVPDKKKVFFWAVPKITSLPQTWPIWFPFAKRQKHSLKQHFDTETMYKGMSRQGAFLTT